MLHSSALTGGKDKETSVCDPSYSVSLPGSRYHSHLQNSPASSVQNVKLFKVIEIGKNYFATQPPFACGVQNERYYRNGGCGVLILSPPNRSPDSHSSVMMDGNS